MSANASPECSDCLQGCWPLPSKACGAGAVHIHLCMHVLLVGVMQCWSAVQVQLPLGLQCKFSYLWVCSASLRLSSMSANASPECSDCLQGCWPLPSKACGAGAVHIHLCMHVLLVGVMQCWSAVQVQLPLGLQCKFSYLWVCSASLRLSSMSANASPECSDCLQGCWPLPSKACGA